MSSSSRALGLMCVMLVALSDCVHSPPAHSEEVALQLQRETERRTLEGGLLIQDVAIGTGPEAKAESTVEINFVAMFFDGTVWDSSAKRKRSLSFALGSPGLIQGLRLGIEGMRAGGKRRLEIPWMLAYGEIGRYPVPAKTDLIYEIELLRVHSPSTPDEAAPRQ